ncbi:MAG: rRNA maturation RNase YbeY [Patescibacteria group bacterium]
MINFDLDQSKLKGGQRVPYLLIEQLLKEVNKHLELGKNKLRISIAFVSDREIRRFNKKYRGKDAVTDVLAFIMPAQNGNEKMLGEILISYSQAKKQANEFGNSTRGEALLLIVHGVLHLFGLDHEVNLKQANKMFALQAKILKRFGVAFDYD